MTKSSQDSFGVWGEKVAAWYLENKGYKIKNRHYTSRYGEIDLIVENNDCLVFVEVKTRAGEGYGMPEQAVSTHKFKKMRRVILAYLSQNNVNNFRLDVVAIIFYKKIGKIKIRHHQSVTSIRYCG